MQDHDGHGPEFCKHMNRLNQLTGTNISVSARFRLYRIKCFHSLVHHSSAEIPVVISVITLVEIRILYSSMAGTFLLELHTAFSWTIVEFKTAGAFI